eukprot:TRINITY_DN11174_c0_g1_i1.p1 TRINITY_DN11174_c0_g1~~TRINITY_DN11174_c0_g1_i1.p1  ORF type:complete len:688 (+),score=114.57 TRINITY_DN11174_c0_g1_i1:301-2064(+)
MRPKYEIFNTTHADGMKLQATKRLIDVALKDSQTNTPMPDDIRIHRHLSETLHGLKHVPLLHQQWDPERMVDSPLKTDSEGTPYQQPPKADFPRFYDREMFKELNDWQVQTNDLRYNSNTEAYVYFHFWAHDDKWVWRRRNDVSAYVRDVAEDILREKLESVQKSLYGTSVTYPPSNGKFIIKNSPLTLNQAEGFTSGEITIFAKPTDPKTTAVTASGTAISWKVGRHGKWESSTLNDEGHYKINIKRVEDTITIRIDDSELVVPTTSGNAGQKIDLTPPSDLYRALPGWSDEEVKNLYRQELQLFEEELVNILYNIDTIMKPTEMLYAAQNELLQMATRERKKLRQSQKDYDWWFHHQSFVLYLPFMSEDIMHRLMNWRSTINQKIGNSPWVDSMRQYSPQPVNCLMQVFRKHNNVWDSRVFKVEHDEEGMFQEESSQEWSFVDDHPDPQPTAPSHIREVLPRPIVGVEKELTDVNITRDLVWSQMTDVQSEVNYEGEPKDFADAYFRDSFAARKRTGMPVHPEDQPGFEVDPEPQFQAVPEADRAKYIRRIGKLYRKYLNPYHPNPGRFLSGNKQPTDETIDRLI